MPGRGRVRLPRLRQNANARRSTRRYCSSPCRQRAYRAGRRPILAPVAHQRRIRDAGGRTRSPPRRWRPSKAARSNRVPFAEAKALIVRYEWLGTMPTVTRACYGLRTPEGELAGVAVFAAGPAPESGDLCGQEHRDRAICLARGACVHWAHPHAASHLISKACRLAAEEFGWRIFFAYSDPTAGEIGTVYQACNWLYLGEGVGRSKDRGRCDSSTGGKADGARSARFASDGCRSPTLRSHPNWIPDFTPDKGRYVRFEGTRREKRARRRRPRDGSRSQGERRRP